MNDWHDDGQAAHALELEHQQQGERMDTPKVFSAIVAVQSALVAEGISKDRKNEQQGYKFRGIDDMYNAIAPLLAKNRLCILPSFSDRTVVERLSQKQATLIYVNVAGKFTFVSAEDGSSHTVGPFYGEAMDSGDKATNKAQSAAYKYMCMQTFCIPTEGDNDADATTHVVAAAPKADPFDSLDDDSKDFLSSHAKEINRLFNSQGDVYGYVQKQNFTLPMKKALWTLLPNNVKVALSQAASEMQPPHSKD